MLDEGSRCCIIFLLSCSVCSFLRRYSRPPNYTKRHISSSWGGQEASEFHPARAASNLNYGRRLRNGPLQRIRCNLANDNVTMFCTSSCACAIVLNSLWYYSVVSRGDSICTASVFLFSTDVLVFWSVLQPL